MRQNLFTLLFAALCAAVTPASAQQLIGAQLLGSRTAAQLSTQFAPLTLTYGVKFYKVTYTTPDVKGVRDTASGLLVLPDNASRVYPRLVYQHGTSSSRTDVPSNYSASSEGNIGLLFAGLGYIAVLPDYLGLGTSRGFHPYVHAASEASAALDMLRATDAFCRQNGAAFNPQLFITGYSQGGHAAMALHQVIETKLANEFTVTAAAPLSGPYSISEVMRDLILSEKEYLFPAYVTNTILSYQTAYGNLFKKTSDVFKPAYAGFMEQYFTGQISLTRLNTLLVSTLRTNEGVVAPRRMLQDSIVTAVTGNPKHPFNVALRDNDVFRWAPKAPTRLFYCMGDDQVPFRNSLLARDSMTAFKALNLQASDVNPTADHGACVAPALTNTVFFFGSLQQIGTVTSVKGLNELAIEFGPNPSTGWLNVRNAPANSQLWLYDLTGRVALKQPLNGAAEQLIDISTLNKGLYVLRIQSGQQNGTAKLVIEQ